MTTNIYPASASADATAAQQPLWAWNGLDTSQFEGTDAFQSAACSIVLSAPASAAVVGGKVLRIVGTVTASGAAVRLLTQTFPFTSTLRRLRIEIDVLQTNQQYVGVAFLADDSGANLFSYNHYLIGTAGGTDRVDNGVLVTTGTHFYGSIPSMNHGRAVVHVAADKVAATRPRFRISGILQASEVGYGTPFNVDARQTDWDSEPAPAGWTGLACDRIGLVVYGTLAGGDLTCDIEAMRIYAE